MASCFLDYLNDSFNLPWNYVGFHGEFQLTPVFYLLEFYSHEESLVWCVFFFFLSPVQDKLTFVIHLQLAFCSHRHGLSKLWFVLLKQLVKMRTVHERLICVKTAVKALSRPFFFFFKTVRVVNVYFFSLVRFHISFRWTLTFPLPFCSFHVTWRKRTSTVFIVTNF